MEFQVIKLKDGTSLSICTDGDRFITKKLTCSDCKVKDCECRDDPYNVDGECMMEK